MTYPMVILRGNGRNAMPGNLLLRGSAYDAAVAHTILPLYKTNIAERGIYRQNMLYITKIPGENDSYMMNPYYSSGIYKALLVDN